MHGRIRAEQDKWRTFVRSKTVWLWITLGFSLMWLNQPPPSMIFENHSSTYANKAFVTKFVSELIATQAAAVADFPLLCVLPLGVVTRAATGKQRLIFDARYINQFIDTPKFKYETLSHVHEILQPGDYTFVLDLQAGFHHLDMHPDAYPYLGFEWQGQLYHFKQLPFGLAPAPWAFTKLMGEVIQHWRSRGFRCLGYIDDMLHANQPLLAAQAQRDTATKELAEWGCVVNLPKSQDCSQRSIFLGAIVDTAKGAMFVPAEKRERVLQLINYAVTARRTKIREIECLVGHLLSLSFSFGPISIMMTRSTAMWIADMLRLYGTNARDRHYSLSSEALTELQFWATAFPAFEGKRLLWRDPFVHVIHTDAAGPAPFTFGGWGGWMKYNGQMLLASGRFSRPMFVKSSTLLELEAMRNTLVSFYPHAHLDGQRVLLVTDSKAGYYIITKGGSMKGLIHKVVLDILWDAISRGIDLQIEWVRREHNAFADALSKGSHACDWKLNPECFSMLSSMHGPFATDLFASDHNTQLPKFYSWHHCPSATAINAFSQHWGRREWCNPPFNLIGRVLDHARICKARLCLIAPYWLHARWWHKLLSSQHLFQSYVHACTVLPHRSDLFLSGYSGSTASVAQPKWHTLALLIDFASPASTIIRVPCLSPSWKYV